MTNDCDEIAILAKQCMSLGVAKGHEAIELNIAAAVAGGRWEEMNKWHRVRLRARRLQQESATVQSLPSRTGERGGCGTGLRPA